MQKLANTFIIAGTWIKYVLKPLVLKTFPLAENSHGIILGPLH